MSASEPASLTSAILTKKGHAAPTRHAYSPATLSAIAPVRVEAPRDSWEREVRAETPPATQTADSEPAAKQLQRRRPDPRTRVSLRLDDSQHLRLRLTAAHKNQTMQAVMMAALDSYLVECKQVLLGGRCACLEGSVDPKQCVTVGATKG